MTSSSEIDQLENLTYQSKIKLAFLPFIICLAFLIGFLNSYPVGQELKTFLNKNLKGTGCSAEFENINFEWLLPKIILSDINLPSGCLGSQSTPLKLSFLKINFNFISFMPLGIPFKIETEFNGQPLTAYLIFGLNQKVIRIKDQSIVLSRLHPLLGGKFKLSGNLVLDLFLKIENQNVRGLELKAKSSNLQIPPQNIEGLTTPQMKVNTFYAELSSPSPTKISINKLIIGDTQSPLRSNFKGQINLLSGGLSFSPISLKGEMTFSESFKQSLPLLELLFQSYTQKDGFYQIGVGGTLGQPTLVHP